jgi:hypothetical protein
LRREAAKTLVKAAKREQELKHNNALFDAAEVALDDLIRAITPARVKSDSQIWEDYARLAFEVGKAFGLLPRFSEAFRSAPVTSFVKGLGIEYGEEIFLASCDPGSTLDAVVRRVTDAVDALDGILGLDGTQGLRQFFVELLTHTNTSIHEGRWTKTWTRASSAVATHDRLQSLPRAMARAVKRVQDGKLNDKELSILTYLLEVREYVKSKEIVNRFNAIHRTQYTTKHFKRPFAVLKTCGLIEHIPGSGYGFLRLPDTGCSQRIVELARVRNLV